MRVVPQTFIANDGKSFDTEEACLAHDAEQDRLGMEQWNISFLFRCELKDEYKPTYMKCPSCRGACRVGGGFGDMDGPRDCDTCFGSGSVIDKNPEHVDAPPIPADLKEAMLTAWRAWWKDRNDRLQR